MSDQLSEQAALLRECRAALDALITQRPGLSGLVCGSTTLGNLRAELGAYRSQVAQASAPQSLAPKSNSRVAVVALELQHQAGGFDSHDAMLKWINACLNCNTNHVQAAVRAPTNSEAAKAVRANGGAAVVFSADEVNDADPASVESRLVELGGEVIQDLSQHHRSRGDVNG